MPAAARPQYAAARAATRRPHAIACGIGAACLAVLAWLGVCSAAHAEWRLTPEDPIATDRPGNGNAATSVTRGHLNLEAGALYALPERDVHLLSFPTLLRLGVLQWLELRAGYGLVGYQRTPAERGAELTDVSAGVKFSALSGDGARPDLAFSADLFLPTGTGPFTSDGVVPDMRALLAWGLPADLGLLLNGGLVVARDASDEPDPLGLFVVNLGYGPSALEGRLSAFVEAFGLIGDGQQALQIDWGLSGLIHDDLQWDVFFQHGLTDDAPDFQASLGCSARF